MWIACPWHYVNKIYGFSAAILVEPGGWLPENQALHKPTWQTSTKDSGESFRAVDGSREPDYTHHSCTQSERADYPAWAVDLGYPMHVAMVTVTNRECMFNWDICLPIHALDAGFGAPVLMKILKNVVIFLRPTYLFLIACPVSDIW